MRTKKKTSATNRKVDTKKTRRHGRPQTGKKRSGGLLERTLDRLTPA